MPHAPNFTSCRYAAVGWVLLALSGLSACTTLNPHLAPEDHLFNSPLVSRFDGPHVEIIVASDPARLEGATVAVFPFRHHTDLDGLGAGFALLTYDRLLQRHFASLVSLAEDTPFDSRAACAIGRHRGADLVIFGDVGEFRDGGVTSTSKVSITLQIIDVASGIPLWYGLGRLEARSRQHADYILYREKAEDAPSPRLLGAVLTERLWDEMLQSASDDAALCAPQAPRSPVAGGEAGSAARTPGG